MNLELTANLWAILDAGTGLIYAVCGRAYALSGDDKSKLAILRALSINDFRCATRLPLPERFTVCYQDGTQKSCVTTPQAVSDENADLFEHVFRQLEDALPPLPNFETDVPTKQQFPKSPLCVRTIVFEDDAGFARAIVNDDDRQWLTVQLRKLERVFI